MNRHERRAAKKRGGATFVEYGYLSERDQNYGLSIDCYVCGLRHKALGLARIQDNQSGTTTHVPLCEPCRRAASDDRDLHTASHSIMRKFWNAPDLEISEGGEATTEQVLAMAEKQDAKEH